jgi:pyruvate,orthophosphate dikinase
MTSHAAVVARGMGTCCVTGCESLTVNEEAKQLHHSATTGHDCFAYNHAFNIFW